MKKIVLFFLLLIFLFPTSVLGTMGVGVGTGKIQIDENLKPGTIYNFPPFTIINTGDQPSYYEAGISYHEKQSQLMPDKSWFIFSPQRFYLDPGKDQVVTVKLRLPITARPGDYFAYLEGYPTKKSQQGETNIGIAAAAKLYFTVVPANIFYGMYYRLASIWRDYSPWSERIAIGIGVLIFYFIIKKYFHIKVGLKKDDDGLNKKNNE